MSVGCHFIQHPFFFPVDGGPNGALTESVAIVEPSGEFHDGQNFVAEIVAGADR